MRIIRHGTAPLDQDLEEIASFEVSTQTRRAAIKGLHRLERLAAARRRQVLLALMAALSAVVGMCAAHLIPWWSAAIPGGLLLIFVVVARISVRIMLRGLDARYREIRHGNDESTIFLSRKDFAKLDALAHAASGTADAATKPGGPVGPHSDHHADLCFEAAGASDGSHYRPVSPGATSSTCRARGPVTADAPDSASDSPPADAGGESRKVASMTVVKSRC